MTADYSQETSIVDNADTIDLAQINARIRTKILKEIPFKGIHLDEIHSETGEEEILKPHRPSFTPVQAEDEAEDESVSEIITNNKTKKQARKAKPIEPMAAQSTITTTATG